MALTRAQLISGNSSQGVVLANQVQGVKQGSGVIIAADGTISFDPTTATGLVRLNNSLGYNGYVWPSAVGGAGQVLQGDGLGNLTWVSQSTTLSSGLGVTIDGTFLKVSIPTASTPPTVGAGAVQAIVGSLYWDDTLNQLFIYYTNGGTPVWVQAAPSATGGGGGSTYTATAPIVVTGTVISVNLGLGVAANGTNLAFKMPVAATPPAINTTVTGAFDGSMYWDDTLGQLFIRYINGGSSAWVAAAPPAGGVPAASSAEAAAGLITTKYSSPATAVAKDAAGTTGAALIPAGTDAQRAAIASPVVGMQRFNTTSGDEEVYTGATLGWRKLAYVPSYDPAPTDLVISANTTLEGSILCKNLTINSGVTVTVANYGVVIYCTETATINGSINADFAGGVGVGSFNPGYGAGAGRQDFNSTSSGWNGPGVAASTYAPGFYLGGSAPQSSYAFVDATSLNGSFDRTAGGNGGGSISIVARGAITVAATSTLSAKGQAGGGYTSATGYAAMVGCSGGSGGTVVLQSDKSVSMAGTINVSGGAGGGAGCAGAGCSTGIGGGNGGGGGTVVLQSPLTSNTGTVTLTGGAGGSGINGAGVGLQLGAVSGAGNGGAGGVSQSYLGPVNGSAGSNGVIVFSGSPF